MHQQNEQSGVAVACFVLQTITNSYPENEPLAWSLLCSQPIGPSMSSMEHVADPLASSIIATFGSLMPWKASILEDLIWHAACSMKDLVLRQPST